MKTVNDAKLRYMDYLNRETGFHHHHYEEEMLEYDYIKTGDMRAMDECERMMNSGNLGHLSDDPVRNQKYLFVAAITFAVRSAIEGGMDEERAYNASDLFIQQMDRCTSIEEIKTLHREAFLYYTTQVAAIRTEHVYSKPVVQCIYYIYNHLGEKITLKQLADETGLNPNYLSAVFHNELAVTISDYIKDLRITAAKNMLRHSDFSYSDIAAVLAYSSQSHFTKVFRECTGYTPKDYRNRFYRNGYLHFQPEEPNA